MGFLRVWRGQHGRLEVAHLAAVVEDEIAVGVADGLAAATVRADIADHRADLAHGVFTLKHEHHDPAPPFGFWIGREVLEDIIADQLLNSPVLRVVCRDDDLRVFLHQFRAGREHSGGCQFQAGAADQSGEDATRARFVQGIRRDDDVGEFLRHNGTIPPLKPAEFPA